MDFAGDFFPHNVIGYVAACAAAVLAWVVKGYANDVKEIKETHMERDEITKLFDAHQSRVDGMFEAHQKSTAQSFAALQTDVASRHTENMANFRELRVRLDSLNDTLLKSALGNGSNHAS